MTPDKVMEALGVLSEMLGCPSPQTLIEARIYVNTKFPDIRSRQAFFRAMVKDMCEEFDLDHDGFLEYCKEGK